MVALPVATAVTSPLSSTLATEGLSEDQLTVLSVAFSGITVALRVALPPTSSESVAGETVTLVTLTSPAMTVSLQVACLPSQDAVITTDPGLSAVTRPFFTVATLLSDDVQVMVLPAASAGDMVAVICNVPPSTISALSTSSSMPVTVISPDLLTTVTGQDANLPPAEAVMDVVPSASAIMVPSVVT